MAYLDGLRLMLSLTTLRLRCNSRAVHLVTQGVSANDLLCIIGKAQLLAKGRPNLI